MSSRSLRPSGRKIGVAALAASLGLAGLGLAASPASALPGFEFERLAGDDRIETAVDISQNTFDASATALIARADLYPDALAGNYLAGAEQAPILLSHTGDVPAETLAELDRLNVTDVTLLGGTAALDESVVTELEDAGFTVNREAGTDRYKTAAEIAGTQDAATIGEVDGLRTALLATGEKFPDALAGGPVAYAGNHPILLTPTATLGEDAAGALEALEIEQVLILGGTAAVSAAAEAEVEAMDIDTQRLQGNTRYDTATAIADFALTQGFSDEHINVATGQKFPDALTGGPHAGEELTPIILANEGNTTEACAYLTEHADTLADGHIYGGTAAVSEAAEATLEECAQGEEQGQSGQIVDEVPGTSYTFVDETTGEVVTVTYDADDTFTVDGATVSLAVFSAAVDAGDEVNFLDDESTTDADEHNLTNVDVTEGTVGNVDLASNTFEIINPVTGDTVGGPFTFAGADDAYTVDGAGATLANFEAAINEGDTIAVDESGDTDTFDLTNETVEGTVSDSTAAAGVTTFMVDGALGDDHVDADDLLYEASAAAETAGTESYTVDGETATYAEFEGAINDGDQITYSRSGGVESFALTNEAPTAVSGQGVADLNDADDTFTVATAEGDEVVDYTGTTQYVVDGVVVTEVEFEDAYSAGDEVTFQAGDADTSTAQSLSLTNEQLAGQLANPVVGVIGADDAPPADTYDVLAANGTTVLDTVDYTADITGSGGDRYFVNGGEVNLAEWEERLDELDLTDDDLDDVVTVVDGTLATEHRLVTDDPDLP